MMNTESEWNQAIEAAAEEIASTAASLAGHIMFTPSEKIPHVEAAVHALSEMVDGVRALKK